MIIGISPLLRHELALPYLLFLGYVVAAKRRIPVPAIASCILSLGPYMVFRVWYYADPFPNAFYLKDAAWFTQGLKYVYDAVLPYQAVPYLLAAFVLYLALRHARERGAMSGGRRAAMVLMGLPVALYVVRIGGDPRHFRFLAFPFILAVLATGGLVETAAAGWARRSRVYLAVVGVILGLAAASGFPRQLQQHPLFRSRFGYKHDGFLLINDAAAHRLHPTGLTPSWQSCGELLDWQAARRRYAAAAAPAEPAEAGRKVWFAAEGKGQDGKPAWVVADSWCLTAYMRPALPCIHSLGLTEPFLARMRMEADRPAHKFGLHGPAGDIAEIRAEHGFGIGVFDKALAGKSAVPGWIAANLPAIRLLERKAYNRHNLAENIGLALTRVPKIDPGPGGSRKGAQTRPRKKRQGRAARSRPSGPAGAPASRGG